MRIFQLIPVQNLVDITGGANRVTVRKNNDDVIRAMTTLKSDIETLGKAQIEKQSSSSSMLPMMMMMMQNR